MTGKDLSFTRDRQFYKFSAYGFLKNLRFFEPFIILYFREMGFSFLDIGILFAIREMSTVFLEVPTGFVADIGGRRTSMIFSMLAYIVSFLTFFFFRSYAAAVGAMVLFASGEAFRTGTHKAMILEYLRITGQSKWKPDYYGATRAASKLGSAVNALLAAALVLFTGSFRYIFLAAAFPCVLNMMNLASYPSVLNGTDVETGQGRPELRDTLRYFISIFRNTDSRLSILNSAAFDAVFKVLREYLQPVLKALAIGLPILTTLSGNRRTAIVTGLVYFVLFLGASTASRFSGRFSRRIRGVVSSINITWIIGFSMLIIAGIFQEMSIYLVTILAYIILFVLQNLRRPLCVTYISDKVPHMIMASGLSAESLIKMIIMTVLAPVCGYVADIAGIGIAVAAGGVLMGLFYLPLRLGKSVSAV